MLTGLFLFTGACLALAVVIFVAACAWNLAIVGWVRILDWRHRARMREEWAAFYRTARQQTDADDLARPRYRR